MRRDLLKGNKSALERLANDAGDSLPDFRARLKSEIDDLVQRQKENSYVQRQKIFKDSRKLAEGKIKEIKINNKVMKADEIEALANSDKLIGNKRMYEKALPQLKKTIKIKKLILCIYSFACILYCNIIIFFSKIQFFQSILRSSKRTFQSFHFFVIICRLQHILF